MKRRLWLVFGVSIACATVAAVHPAASPTSSAAERTGVNHLGLYEFTDRSAVFVGQIAEVPAPLSVEFDNSRVRILHERGPNAYVTGPTAGAASPVQSELEFEPGSLRWREAGIVRTAVRVSYRAEQVRFRSNGAELAGVLTLPNTPPPYAAAVFAHGSGAQTRDFFYATPLFLRRGVAVLTFDKRGVGASTGDWRTASIADLADDVIAGVNLLRSRADIRKDRVGVYGASEGGWVAPLAASKKPDLISFVVARSASGLVNRENRIYEIENDLRANGYGESVIAAMRELHRQDISVIKANGAGWNEMRAARARAAQEPWFPLVRLDANIIEFNASNRAQIESWLRQQQRQWIDPADFWPRVRCPVLIQNGLVDRNVPTERSFEIITAAIAKSGNRSGTLKAYPGGDHGLFQSRTGYASDIPNTQGFVPGYLKDLEDWIDSYVVR